MANYPFHTLGLPKYSQNPKHTFELLYHEDIKEPWQLAVQFAMTMVAQAQFQQTAFLQFHFDLATDKSAFLDFLEHVKHSFTPAEFNTTQLTDDARKGFRQHYPTNPGLFTKPIEKFIDQKRLSVKEIDSLIAVGLIQEVMIGSSLVSKASERDFELFLNNMQFADKSKKVDFRGGVGLLGSIFYHLSERDLLLISNSNLISRLCDWFTIEDQPVNSRSLKNVMSDSKSSKLLRKKEVVEKIIGLSGENTKKLIPILSRLFS